MLTIIRIFVYFYLIIEPMAKISILNEREKYETILYKGPLKKDKIMTFIESETKAQVHVEADEKGIRILRKSQDNTTLLDLREKAKSVIHSAYGDLELPVKRLAYHYGDDAIRVLYEITDRCEFKIVF